MDSFRHMGEWWEEGGHRYVVTTGCRADSPFDACPP